MRPRAPSLLPRALSPQRPREAPLPLRAPTPVRARVTSAAPRRASLGATLRSALLDLAPDNAWVNPGLLGSRIARSVWEAHGYASLRAACQAEGIDAVSDGGGSGWLVRAPHLGQALRRALDELAPGGGWVAGTGALGSRFTRKDWGFGSLKQACLDEGLCVDDDYYNGYWCVRMHDADVALRNAVRRLEGFPGAWVPHGRLAHLHRRADWKYAALRDACHDAGVEVSGMDRQGQWDVSIYSPTRG